MKIAVIGAGIIGVTTAYELSADGHEVTVFERRSAAAEETSFANAGIVAPGYVTPWAAPGMPAKVMRHLFSAHGPVKLAWPLSARDIAWMWRWWRACTPDTYLATRQQLQQLAFYSRERLHQLTHDLQLQYDRSDGFLVLLRDAQDNAMVQPGLQLLRELGVPFNEVPAHVARAVEPALNNDTALFGAVHVPGDEVGNCRQFALQLKDEAQRLGCRFEFNTEVARLEMAPTRVWTRTRDGSPPQAQAFDAVVLCAGVHSAELARPLGVSIPLTAVYGHSVSVAVREDMDAPVSGVMDERYKVAISRLGQRVRVAGGAEIGGRVDRHGKHAFSTLHKVLNDWFPGAARYSRTGGQMQTWKGARPMLPEGPPLVGASLVPGLWLNLGHGSSGWALSGGSARALADTLAGRSPAIDVAALSPQRLAR
ncbi:D-amino acid dehydrogenase [Hydrogenophaga sp. OTU3427]|uniref:D-amino acid dehydrogenase n=1 Tax=Hydrogenophaga sp. OTU3427 TaxID=3043856 RepID=UPI00313B8ABE